MIGTIKAKFMSNNQIKKQVENDLSTLQKQVLEMEELLFIHTQLALQDNSIYRKDNLAQMQRDILALHSMINNWSVELGHIKTLEDGNS